MLKYLFFKLASVMVPFLPAPLAYGLAWVAAEIAFLVARGARQAATANLRHVLGPQGTPQELARSVRGIFHTAAYNYIDMFLIPRIPPQELSERAVIQNPKVLLDAYTQGRGIVLTTAHFGNFDLLIQVSVVHHIPVTVLIEQLSPPELHELVARLRGSHGVRLVPTGPKSIRELLRVLRAGGVVAVVADRNIQRRGMAVPFFGAEAHLPTGAIELALHTGAALIPAFGLRLPNRRYQITIEQPFELEGERPAPESVARNLARLVPILERHIREHPEQWVVFEPVWDRVGPETSGDGPQEQVTVAARR